MADSTLKEKYIYNSTISNDAYNPKDKSPKQLRKDLQTPGIFKSLGSSFYQGLELGSGRGIQNLNGIKASAMLGMTGAAIGASLASSYSDGTVDPALAGAVGAGVGALALPATGLAIGALGSGIVGTAKMVPGMAMGLAKGAAMASPYVTGFAAQGASNVANKVWGIGSRLVDWREGAEALDKVKLTGPISGIKNGWARGGNKIQKTGNAITGSIINGKTLLAGEALYSGVKKAWNTLEKANMGQMMGVTTLTPRTPSYANNAGATGDLVFAMNANRRG